MGRTKLILFRMNKFLDKICLSGIEVIRNKTFFGTAVHLLILVQIAPISDDIPSKIWSKPERFSPRKTGFLKFADFVAFFVHFRIKSKNCYPFLEIQRVFKQII